MRAVALKGSNDVAEPTVDILDRVDRNVTAVREDVDESVCLPRYEKDKIV